MGDDLRRQQRARARPVYVGAVRIQPFVAEHLAITSICSMRHRISVGGARAGALSAQQTVTRRRQAGGGVLR